MDVMQEKIWDTLCEMDGEQVARLFTNYHGNQIIDEGFYDFMVDEGYIEDYEED